MRSKLLMILTLALAVASCHGSGDGDDLAEAREALKNSLAPQKVRLVAPETRKERPAIDIVGEVRAFDSVTLASELAGRVEKVSVEVGDRVRTGQELVTIDRQTYELRLRQAEARVEAAKADVELARKALERKRDLVSDHTIPQATFDQAQATYELAAANLLEAIAARDLADHNLEVSTLRAPAPGSITGRQAVVGKWADVGEGLIEMAVGSKVKIVARVPSRWVMSLQGLEGFDFSVDTQSRPRHAKLYSIDPVVDEASRSFEVVGTSPAEGLRPGMFANVTLTSPEPVKTLWLPVTAIVTSDTPKVYRVEDGRVAIRRVQTGPRDDGMIEIVSGLSADEEVIANIAGLSRDMPVEVVE